MPRRLAVCSWSLRPTSPQDLLAQLHETGLDAVQLALGPIVREPETWANTIETIREGGIEIVSGMMATVGEDYTSLQTIAETGGVRPDSTWSENLEHAEAVAELAAAAGIGLVTFHAGFIPESAADPEHGVLVGRLQTIADRFAAAGVRVGFETGQETAVALLEALEHIGRPNVGVNFDPANMILYAKGDPVDAVTRLRPHVVQIHIKDAVATSTPGTWGSEVPVGTGAVDWSGFLDATRGLDVDFVIEREAGENRIAEIRQAAMLVRAHGI